MSIACVLVANLPLKTELLRQPDLRGKAALVIEQSGSPEAGHRPVAAGPRRRNGHVPGKGPVPLSPRRPGRSRLAALPGEMERHPGQPGTAQPHRRRRRPGPGLRGPEGTGEALRRRGQPAESGGGRRPPGLLPPGGRGPGQVSRLCRRPAGQAQPGGARPGKGRRFSGPAARNPSADLLENQGTAAGLRPGIHGEHRPAALQHHAGRVRQGRGAPLAAGQRPGRRAVGSLAVTRRYSPARSLSHPLRLRCQPF